MQIELEISAGEAMVCFASTKALLQTRILQMVNCKSCDKEVLMRYEKSYALFSNLLSQVANHKEQGVG